MSWRSKGEGEAEIRNIVLFVRSLTTLYPKLLSFVQITLDQHSPAEYRETRSVALLLCTSRQKLTWCGWGQVDTLAFTN